MPANQFSSQINGNRLLRELWINRGLSRIQLAQRLELDKSTVSLLVNPLAKAGILETISEGSASSRGGRKPLALGIRGEYTCFLGLEIQPDGIYLTLLDLRGRVKETRRIPEDLAGPGSAARLGERLLSLYWEYEARYPLMAMGAGLSGIVDTREGRIIKAMLLDIKEGCTAQELVPGGLPCPLIIENDANCCTWGELMLNREGEKENILFLLLESDYFQGRSEYRGRFSLGMGLSLGGRVHRGRQFGAGEFRSILWGGEAKSQFSLSHGDLSRLGENPAIREKLFREIGRNMAFLNNALDLDRICVGGNIEKYGEEFRSILAAELASGRSYHSREECPITLSSLGEYAVSFGAAAMLLMELFNTDQSQDRKNALQGREALENFKHKQG
ncbi:MAG: ROK family transcriptional regulator [Spirochaetales bacterium]|nr:ROK family transcriptional regulator [Spirochaetales bacterium]